MMDALTRAKEYLANQAADGTQRTMHAGHPDVLLAALVAEIEAAPVVEFAYVDEYSTDGPFFIVTPSGIGPECCHVGKRVRLLALDSGGAGEVGDNFNHNEEKGYG